MSPPRRAARYSTRLLLAAAAVGAAGGLLCIGLGYAMMAMPQSTLAYAVGTATIGLWALGPLIALALFRLPGVALLAALAAGVVNLVVPTGVAMLTTFLQIGVLLELPFAATLYRRWSDRFLRVALPIGLLLLAASYFLFCLASGVILMDEFLPWLAIGTVVGTAAVIALLSRLALRVAAQLRRAGLGARSTDRLATATAEEAAQP